MAQTIVVNSIREFCQLIESENPSNPLITLVDTEQLEILEESVGIKTIYGFYMIFLKDSSCGAEYGRNEFDFDKGVMTFSAPGQAYTATKPISKGEIKGWMLLFHPDLIRGTHLGEKINSYSFFNYDVFEALHLSSKEENTINDVLANIKGEYLEQTDNHSNKLIVSNLDLLLSYCRRFYERQFDSRTVQGKDIVSSFEIELKNYFKSKLAYENGSPSVSQFAAKVNLSQHYFSDLIKRETGRSPKEHINGHIIEKAKDLLSVSNSSISEIAYELGFNYPHYFTRMFKSKTGLTPQNYREQIHG